MDLGRERVDWAGGPLPPEVGGGLAHRAEGEVDPLLGRVVRLVGAARWPDRGTPTRQGEGRGGGGLAGEGRGESTDASDRCGTMGGRGGGGRPPRGRRSEAGSMAEGGAAGVAERWFGDAWSAERLAWFGDAGFGNVAPWSAERSAGLRKGRPGLGTRPLVCGEVGLVWGRLVCGKVGLVWGLIRLVWGRVRLVWGRVGGEGW